MQNPKGPSVPIPVFFPWQVAHAIVWSHFLWDFSFSRKIRHKNIVRFLGACTKPKTLCIVTGNISANNDSSWYAKFNLITFSSIKTYAFHQNLWKMEACMTSFTSVKVLSSFLVCSKLQLIYQKGWIICTKTELFIEIWRLPIFLWMNMRQAFSRYMVKLHILIHVNSFICAFVVKHYHYRGW